MTDNTSTRKYAADFTYRLLAPAELLQYRDEIINVGFVSFTGHSGVLEPVHATTLTANLQNDKTWNDLLAASQCFVALNGTEIAGMAHFIPAGHPWDIFRAEWCYLRMVSVKPCYQGQGIARKLTEMCLCHARQTGGQTLALHTSEFMHAARHIYESLGFTVLEEIPRRLGKRYWLYTLEL